MTRQLYSTDGHLGFFFYIHLNENQNDSLNLDWNAWPPSDKHLIFWVRSLASPCRPLGALSGEPLTRANQTITPHPLMVTSCTWGQPQVTRSTSRALWADPGEPLERRQSYSNVPGAHRGRPREANRTHPHFILAKHACKTSAFLYPLYLTDKDRGPVWFKQSNISLTTAMAIGCGWLRLQC